MNLSPKNTDKGKIEQLRQSLTSYQQVRMLACMLDGKPVKDMGKYLTNDSKKKAAAYTEEKRLELLAANLETFK